MLRIAKFLRPYWLFFSLSVVLLFGQANFELALPDYLSQIINIGIQQPTFDGQGKLVGLGVNRFMRNKASVLVVLPAGDVDEIAQQAAKAKAIPEPEEKPETEKSSKPEAAPDK